MISLTDALRPYWARGINATTVNSSVPFSKWVEAGLDYAVTTQIAPNNFVIETSTREYFLKPISQDCNRFMSAAIESVIDNSKQILTEKSIAWDVIKNYYSAFYAAHFILRVLGYSLSQFDALATGRVEKIADAYGNRNGVDIESGFYICDFSGGHTQVVCSKALISNTGSHGALWKFMADRMIHYSNDIISKNSSPDYQAPSIKLAELVKNLRTLNINGNWLSNVRNEVNYKHRYGCWFPYKTQESSSTKIKKLTGSWKINPMNIELSAHGTETISKFIATTTFIVSLGREISLELTERCPTKNSFTTHGVIQFMKQLKVK
jgi:hypothetical protein